MLKALNLRKSFSGRTVVKGVSIGIKEGEIVALLGKNGAGKTTTFKMILGVVKPESGKILLGNQDITTTLPHERALMGITYLPQEPSVFRKATVLENFLIILDERINDKDKKEKMAISLMEEFNILYLKDSKAYNLSGGERRRVEVARALLIEPRFLLLDEPFSGVDPLTIIDLQEMLLRLKERGIGILISDHNVYDTLEISDKVYIIDSGEMIAEGFPEQVVENLQARKRFFGEDFIFENKKNREV